MPDPEDELVARAKVLAEATGRDFEDVIADLADDGILNESNKKNEADLITQLKEAAELMSAVQNINKEVAENTVLNGGDNKTKVNVDTTLEGDVVDRAIASVNRKVVELKKIALVIAPIFLLLSGGSLEALGVINMFGDDESDDNEMYNDDYWGCTAWDASNYDPMANIDDGTCYWDNTQPTCLSDYQWHDSFATFDSNKHLRVNAVFIDKASCNDEREGQFVVQINRDGEWYGDMTWDNHFNNRWEADYLWSDLPDGEYDVEMWAYMDGSSWHWNLDGRWTVEEEKCTTNLEADESWAQAVFNESNNIEVHIEINNLDPDCPVEVEVMVSVYLNNSYQFTMENDELGRYWVYEDANIKIRDSRIDNLGDGDWSFETRFIPIDEPEYCCQMTNVVKIE